MGKIESGHNEVCVICLSDYLLDCWLFVHARAEKKSLLLFSLLYIRSNCAPTQIFVYFSTPPSRFLHTLNSFNTATSLTISLQCEEFSNFKYLNEEYRGFKIFLTCLEKCNSIRFKMINESKDFQTTLDLT